MRKKVRLTRLFQYQIKMHGFLPANNWKNQIPGAWKYYVRKGRRVCSNQRWVCISFQPWFKKASFRRRLVPFSFMDSYYPRSLCLAENAVFINFCYFDCNNNRIVFSKMNSFDFDGIMSSSWDLSALNINEPPESVIYISIKMKCYFVFYADITQETITYLQYIWSIRRKKSVNQPTQLFANLFKFHFGILQGLNSCVKAFVLIKTIIFCILMQI